MNNSDTISNTPSAELVQNKVSSAAKPLIWAISGYQRLTSGRPSPCRFYPSCSNYAIEAIATHGALRGLGLSLRRLSRCRPLGPHGVDLVPEPKKARSTHS